MYFDSIRVTSSRYEMESQMELLLYRASIRDYSMAKEAWRQQSGPEAKYEAIIDEIEDSEKSMISATDWFRFLY